MAEEEIVDEKEAASSAKETKKQPRGSVVGKLVSFLKSLLVLSLYGLIALASTYPLVLEFTTSLPLGTENSGTLPQVMAWSMWWMSEAIGQGVIGLFDAPVFAPEQGTWSLSRPSLLAALMGYPVLLATPEPAVAYNAVIVTILSLNGLACYGLLKHLRVHAIPAFFAGGMTLMLPMVHQHLGVLAHVPLFAVLYCLRAMLVFGRHPSPWRGIVVGLWLAAASWLNHELAIAFILSASVPCLILVRLRHFKPFAIGGAILTLFVPIVFAVPLFLGYHFTPEVAAEKDLLAGLVSSSATGSSWLRSVWSPLLAPKHIEVVSDAASVALFPGLLKVLLATSGLLYGVRRRHLRRATLFLFFMMVVSVIGSMGASLMPDEGGLWSTLLVSVPGLAWVSQPWQFGLLTHITLVIFAGFGLQGMMRVRLHTQRPGQNQPVAVRGLPIVLLLAIVTMLEQLPGPQRTFPVPSHQTWAPLGEWIEANVPEEAVVAGVPFPEGERTSAFEDSARWLYLQGVLARPLANGYGPALPPSYRALQAAMQGFPSPEANALLDEAGVTFVVTTDASLQARMVEEGPSSGWARLFTHDELGVVVSERVAPRVPTDAADFPTFKPQEAPPSAPEPGQAAQPETEPGEPSPEPEAAPEAQPVEAEPAPASGAE